MSDKQAEENVYKKYSIRSEHALFLTVPTNNCRNCTYQYNNYSNDKFNLWIEGKLWEFTFAPSSPSTAYLKGTELQLQMTKASPAAGDNKTAVEIIVWYWNDKKQILILHRKVHDDFSHLKVSIKGVQPVNNKFNVVFRLLDNRNEDGNSLLEPYYGEFDKLGIEMVNLRICGTNGETEASFTVPKLNLMQASHVFHRMFAAEMTEKATGEVKIEDTNSKEFGDFLKAISPKQEHPNPYNVRALLKLADRYQCQLLLDRCEAHLMNCIEMPLEERIKCANLYELKELKKNLFMNFDGTGILEWYRDNKPYNCLMQALTKMIE